MAIAFVPVPCPKHGHGGVSTGSYRTPVDNPNVPRDLGNYNNSLVNRRFSDCR